MSKKFILAFAAACFGVGFAVFQISRVWQSTPAPGRSMFFDDNPAPFSPAQIPQVPGHLPTLRPDPALARKFELVHDHLEAELWVEAIHVLQGLLESTEDSLVAVPRTGADGREATIWTGSRSEANRILASLPPGGREFYDTLYGTRARALFAEARQKDDLRLLAEIVRRYGLTAAGGEALSLLGTYHLDRARYHLAALCFERLQQRPDSKGLPPATLLHAALAFAHAGDTVRARDTWNRLTAQAFDGLRVAGRDIQFGDAQREFDQIAFPATGEHHGGGVPSLQVRWTHPTVHETRTRTWLHNASRLQGQFGQPFLSACLPLLVGDQIIYRSFRGVHAVRSRTGEELWQAPSAWSLEQMMHESDVSPSVDSWISSYLDYSPQALLENSVLGRLSTDGSRIYAVDDLGIPPYQRARRGGRWQPESIGPEPPPRLVEATMHNRLLALDGDTGQQVWAVGGASEETLPGSLTNSHFLGAPLPLDGRLYVLAERSGQISLLCLDASGSLLWTQALAFAPTRMLFDPGRRIHAAQPVFAEGMLVCPTNAGLVVGVDLLTPGLAWAYRYPTMPLTYSAPTPSMRRARPSPTQLIAAWKTPATCIQQGRVVFAASDEVSIHCLNLRDGSPLWKVERTEDDLYVAGVFADKVLVVGQRACRALNLADGKQSWKLDTGLPSGYGVADGNVYYLPLRSTGSGQEPAVYALDVERGAFVARTYSPQREAPGNLLLSEGLVVSHTGSDLIGYEAANEAAK